VALKLSFNDSAFPKGTPVDVGGVLVDNGGSITLSEDQEASLVARHGMSVREYFKDSEMVKVEGSTEVPKPKEGGDN
jgi:hypothetical protein